MNRNPLDMKGEANIRAKLNRNQVAQIRIKYASGSVTQKKLAHKFNITQTQISDIVTRKRWKHLK